MNKKTLFSLLLIIFLLVLAPLQSASAQENSGVVRAVLFYSPTCPHCEYVINEILPPLKAQYGDSLDVRTIDVSTPNGQTLYQDAVAYYNIPDERLGVPTMLVAPDVILVGSGEIPDIFPSLIEAGLAQGGIGWADLPGLAAFIEMSGEASTEAPAPLTMGERFALDPAGNTVSVIVLIGMLVVVGMVAFNFQRPARKINVPDWLIPALTGLGVLVAFYLAFVELTQTEAICGPVGDCNTVQQSPYATLFGFLPVGVLGMIGYLLIFLAWVAQKLNKPAWRPKAAVALWLLSGFGTLFSIYLTFLEPFVIGATCMWCITSAVIQTTIFAISTAPAKQYLSQGRSTKHKKRRRRKKSAAPKRRKRH